MRIRRAASAIVSSVKGRTSVCIRRRYWIPACVGILGALALQHLRGIDAQPAHPCADLRPFLLEEARTLGFAQLGARARSDEHADSALHDDKAFVLEALV